MNKLRYCAGCGRWHDGSEREDGLTGAPFLSRDPIYDQIEICRECWLGDSEQNFLRAQSKGYYLLVNTFYGPWKAIIPK